MEVFCPDCGRQMVQRKGRKPPFRPFYGCPGFFPFDATRNPEGYDASKGEKQCKGMVFNAGFKAEKIVRQELPQIVGSEQQVAIWEEMESGDSHIMVKALAGTGKTTTIVIGASKLRGSVCALAFNKKIERELTARMPGGVQTSTFHAFGKRIIEAAYDRKYTPDSYKTLNIVDGFLPPNMEDKDSLPIKFGVKRLVSLCKNRLLEATEENLTELVARYNIDTNGHTEEIFSLVPKVLAKSAADKSVIDFDDMLWFPIIHGLPFPSFDNVIVDETQDLNPARIEMLFKACPKGRIIVIGDENQAIYGFTGADTEAMTNLEERLSA